MGRVPVAGSLAVAVTLTVCCSCSASCGWESTVRMGVTDLSTVVLSVLHALGAEDVVEFGPAVGHGINPRLDGFEHGAVGVVAHVSESRVVEDVEAIVQHLLLWDIDVLPGVENARCHISKNGGSDLTGRLVEDVGEMVL